MHSLQILCVVIAALALSLGESEAKEHTYRYKTPGHTNTHTYRYKTPGKTNTHHYRYKEPGTVHQHFRDGPGGSGDDSSYSSGPQNDAAPAPAPVQPGNVPGGPDNAYDGVTGVYGVINTIYNYFAVGGHLTGVPPLDLLLLKYYVVQGPKNFCGN